MLIGKTLVITGISLGIGARVGELAVALGADIVGVDVNRPAEPMDAFIQADIGSPQGRGNRAIAAAPHRRALQRRGRSGLIGAHRDSGDQLLRAAGAERSGRAKIARGGAIVSVASIAGYGWRANLERATAFVAAQGFPDARALLAAYKVPDAEAYPLSKELLLLWTMKASHEPLFKDRGLRVNAVSPRSGGDAHSQGIPADLRRSSRRRRHRAGRPRRLGAPISRPRSCFCARTARAG